MHKSQLAGIIIDCDSDDLEAAATFWSKALGLEWNRSDDPAEANYVRLGNRLDLGYVEVQKVNHPSRVHLDIETDDIEAEVARLVTLGAKRLGNVRTWVVMEAPTGQRFCVIRAGHPKFSELANVWD